MAINRKVFQVLILVTILTPMVIEAQTFVSRLQSKLDLLSGAATTRTTTEPDDNDEGDYDDDIVTGLSASMLTGDPYADYFANLTYTMIMQNYRCRRARSKKIQKSLNTLYSGITSCTSTAIATVTNINANTVITNIVASITAIGTQITTCSTTFLTSISAAITCIINLTGSIVGAVIPGGVAAINYANCVSASVLPSQTDINNLLAKCKVRR